MVTLSRTQSSKSKRAMDRALRLSVLAVVAGAATSAQAATNYYFQGANNSTWDGVTAIWASPNSNSLPLTQWISAPTSEAFFSTSVTINVNSPITADSLNFNTTISVTFTGSGMINLNSISNTFASQTINLDLPLVSAGQLTIHGVPYGVGSTNGKGITLGADTNQIAGGVLITGGSVYLNLANSAPRFAVDPTQTSGLSGSFSSPGGIIPGSIVQNAPILLTSISNGNLPYPTITVDGNGSTIGLAGIHTNDYVVPNPVVLNPSNAANFYTAVGAGSVGDSGTVASGPYPAFAVMNFAGPISGNGSVIISNDFYGGGGKGFTVFSSTANSYTGKTIINNNGQNFLTFQIGAAGAIPVTSDVVFGAKSVGQAIGDTSITGKQLGAMDLNGFDVTVRSLSSDVASNLSVLGITNTNNHATDPNLTSGPHATDASKTSTLTIDSQGGLNNTFFQGNIDDGSDFLTQANASSGTYQGPYKGAASNYLIPSNGLKVALVLAQSNSGALTLSSTNGSSGNTTNVPDYSYTGGTTVGGGSLYVNGPMTAPSGTSSQVLVATPLGGHIALLGGTGSITPDIHIQSGAILAPGSTPAAAATVSGTDFSNAPTAFNFGTLTVKNLVMDAGSQLNFVVADGSDVAVAGSGYGTLAFSNTGAFSLNGNGTVTVNAPGAFSGFSDAAATSWALATLPGNVSLSNFALGTVGVPSNQLGGGNFSLEQSGNLLELVFTPSGNVTVLQYAGAASGAWNTSSTNSIWTDIIHGTSNLPYSEPLGNLPNVLFGPISASTLVTIQPGGVAPQSVTFKNAGNTTYTLNGGSINGSTGLALKSPGHVILQSPNAYTGGTAVYSGGILETQVNGALGTADVSLNNGTWLTTTTDQSYTTNVHVFGNVSASPATTSTIQTGPLTGGASGNLTLNGNIVGSGSLTKTGVGILSINGLLSQSGDLNVNAGNLVINGTASYTGTTKVLVGAGIEYNTAVNATIGYQTSVATAGNLAGNLTFDNLTNVTFSPGTYSGKGQVILKTSGSLVQGVGGVLGGSPVDVGNQITLNPLNTPNFVAYIGMAGNGNRFWLHGPITGNGDISFGAGPGQGGGANIDLFTHSSYTGATHLDTGGQAVLTLDINDALPTTTQLIFGSNGQGSGSFELNGHSQTLANISTDPAGGGFGGFGDSIGGGALTVNGNVSTEFKARITGQFTFNIALQNNAVLDLSWQGNNPINNSSGNIYGGFTNVTSGVLRFSNAAAYSMNQNLILNGGVLEIHANGFGNFTNTLGTQQNGDLQVTGGTSGFSAFGSQPAFFNLNGGGTIQWGTPTFQPDVLVLNQTTATNNLTFANTLDLNGATRTVTVNSTLPGTTATITGDLIDTAGGAGFVKAGPGQLVLAGNLTYTGGTTVTGGLLQINNNAAAFGPVSVATGKLVFAATNAARLTPAVMLNLQSHTLASSGVLDVTNHDFMIGNTNLATVESEILNGFGVGAGGAQIASSTALADGNEILIPFDAAVNAITSWDNVPVTQPHTIIAKYTYAADANFDGKVDFNDYTVITGNYGQTTPGLADISASFLAGDLNLDGKVDFNDYTVVTGLYGAGVSGPLGTLVPSAIFTSSVPEPVSLSLFGLGAVLLLKRRRR